MNELEKLREALPAAARDLKINLQMVLDESVLSQPQRWGVAIACALASRSPELVRALLDAAPGLDANVEEDARAAAAIMGMNNVFYRFKNVIGKDEYTSKPARLRMQRLARPQLPKADFELFCLAVSAVNDCPSCVRSHEAAVLENGLTEEHVFDAIRIASVVHGVAVALG